MSYTFKTNYPDLEGLSLYEITYCIWELCLAFNELEKVFGKNDDNILTGAILEAYEDALAQGFLTEQPDGLVDPLTKWYCQNGSFKSEPTWEEFISDEVEEEGGEEEFYEAWVPNVGQISVFWSENLVRLDTELGRKFIIMPQSTFYKDIKLDPESTDPADVILYTRTASKAILRNLDSTDITYTALSLLYNNYNPADYPEYSETTSFINLSQLSYLIGEETYWSVPSLIKYCSLKKDYPTVQRSVVYGQNILRYIDYYRVLLERMHCVAWFIGDHKPFSSTEYYSNLSLGYYENIAVAGESGTTYTKLHPNSGQYWTEYIPSWGTQIHDYWFTRDLYYGEPTDKLAVEIDDIWNHISKDVTVGGNTTSNNVCRLASGYSGPETLPLYLGMLPNPDHQDIIGHLRPIVELSVDAVDKPVLPPTYWNWEYNWNWYALGTAKTRQHSGEFCTKHTFGTVVDGGITYFIATRGMATGRGDFTISSGIHVDGSGLENISWGSKYIFERWVPDISSQTNISQIQLESINFPFKYFFLDSSGLFPSTYIPPVKYSMDPKHEEEDVIFYNEHPELEVDLKRIVTEYYNPTFGGTRETWMHYLGRYNGAFSAYVYIPRWLRAGVSYWELQDVSTFMSFYNDKTSGEIFLEHPVSDQTAYAPKLVTDIAAYLPYLEET